MTLEADFRAGLERDGFTVLEVNWSAAKVNAMHTHDFSARLLCTSGTVTIETADGVRTYQAGEQFDMPAGRAHGETAGVDGAQLVVGRR